MPKGSGRKRSYRSQTSSETLDRDRLLRELDFDERPLRFSLLFRPLYFTILFSFCVFSIAKEWSRYICEKDYQQRCVYHYPPPVTSQTFIQELWEGCWNELTKGEKLFVPIFIFNLFVFALWRIACYQPFMLKLFCQTPANPNLCWPMILSIFSHFSPFHFISNMYTLLSFTKAASNKLSNEQFLFLYLSSGVVSSLASYVYKIYLNQPGLSLGASGAVMGILGYVCTEFPKTSVGIIYIPFYAIPSPQAIRVILALNVIGMITGGTCDYAAHMGGILYGILWSKYKLDLMI